MLDKISPQKIVESWAVDALESWPSQRASHYAEACDYLQHHQSIFVIDVGVNGACIRPKVGGIAVPAVLLRRAQVYERYINSIARSPDARPVSLLIDIGDEAEERREAPVFSFQRRIGTQNPLLPDLDTIEKDFYRDWQINDTQPFRSKLDSAIFVGSTTGVTPIRQEHLKAPFPRLRSFRAFRHAPRVHFRLPNIVQTESEAVTESLLAEGLGGEVVEWRDQIKHKLVISIDGNGAALSRPFIGLATNCALVKYASDSEAWYFSKLVPNVHYISVEQDEDVLRLVEGDMLRHESVASAGRAFVERYLTQSTHAAYMTALLGQLGRRLSA